MKNMGIEFKVGLFTIGGLLCTGYLFVALSPGLLNRQESVAYVTFLRNAGGIVEKSHVKTNGVSIGKVKEVSLGNNNTKVTIEVDKDIKIPKSSVLAIKSVGLLGDSHIEIKRGADDGTFFAEGDFIPESTEGSDLAGLIDIAGSIAADIKKVTENLAHSLGGENGKQALTETVQNIRELTRYAREIMAENKDDLRSMISNLKQVSANLSEVLDDSNKDRLNRIIASFDASMTEVQSATKNINLISQKIEKGEGTLGRLINDDETLTELEGAIKDIREVLAPATKLEVDVDAHIEGRRDKTSQTYFNLVFRTRPDRYYLVGFTDTQDQVVQEQREGVTDKVCTDENPCDEATVTKKQTKQALRFNMQFAKRWANTVLRFGLFETTGGFAADYYLVEDRFRISLEAFDWKTHNNDVRRTAHIKLYASVLFFDHLYFLVGLDDPTKYEKEGQTQKLAKPNWYLGAGLNFNDEDLKALFGAASLTAL